MATTSDDGEFRQRAAAIREQIERCRTFGRVCVVFRQRAASDEDYTRDADALIEV